MFVLAGQNLSPHVVLELLINKRFLIQKCTQANSKLREAGCKSTEMVSFPLEIATLRECNFCIHFLTMGRQQRMVIINLYYALLFYMHMSLYYGDLEPRDFSCCPGLPRATVVPVTHCSSAAHTCPYQYGYMLHASYGIARCRSAGRRIILWCTNLAVAFLISLVATRVRGIWHSSLNRAVRSGDLGFVPAFFSDLFSSI